MIMVHYVVIFPIIAPDLDPIPYRNGIVASVHITERLKHTGNTQQYFLIPKKFQYF